MNINVLQPGTGFGLGLQSHLLTLNSYEPCAGYNIHLPTPMCMFTAVNSHLGCINFNCTPRFITHLINVSVIMIRVRVIVTATVLSVGVRLLMANK